jgi:glucose-1-phosphate thymidylyltransferase
MDPSQVIGLIPAAGRATRLSPLPCSKELYPIGLHSEGTLVRPKVVSHYLLEKMRAAGIRQVCIVLLQSKWDIPAYFKDGAIADMEIIYRVVATSASAPHTLDYAFPFTRHALVAFGFPDILFKTPDAFVRLLARQHERNADVVLGVFPTDEPRKWDMVELDQSGRVIDIDFKPKQTDLTFGWSIAVWTPAFSEFMHEFVAKQREATHELIVGDVIVAAIRERMKVEAVTFPGDRCLDIGTPDDLAKALHEASLSMSVAKTENR